MPDQRGRVAVVTGGGRGVGQAAALALAGSGLSVVAVARSAEQLARTERLAREARLSWVDDPLQAPIPSWDRSANAALDDRRLWRGASETVIVRAASRTGRAGRVATDRANRTDREGGSA